MKCKYCGGEFWDNRHYGNNDGNFEVAYKLKNIWINSWHKNYKQAQRKALELKKQGKREILIYRFNKKCNAIAVGQRA